MLLASISRLVRPVAALVALLSSLTILWLGQSEQIQILSVQSQSMAPLLQKGDAVVVGRIDPATLQTGDIISAPDPQAKGVSITHRVVEVQMAAARLITKGDANVTADPVMDMASVTGKMRYRLINAGYIIDGLRSWPGLIVAVYIPLALVLAGELVRVGRYYSRPTYSIYGLYK